MSADNDNGPASLVTIFSSLLLAIMVADFACLIGDEVKFVWTRIRHSWYARLYMLARYLGMASQIFNVYFTFRMYCGVRTSHAGCTLWFAYQAVVIQLLLTCAEGLLMHRIYALFLRSRIILFILIMFACGQTASMIVSASFTLPQIKHTDTCIIRSSPPGNAYFGATTMMINLIILFMTFSRYLYLPAEWTRQGLGRVVMRDSALSLIAITFVMLFMTLCSLGIIRPRMSGNVTYYGLVCILWVSIGRVVINHEKLPREDEEGGNPWKDALQITSLIELGEISQLSKEPDGSSTQPPWSGNTSRSSSVFMTDGSSTVGGLSAIVPAHVRVPRFSEVPSVV